MEKNTKTRKKSSGPVEPWWNELKFAYFTFYKSHFRDQDGFAMSPDWNPQKIGMEALALKKIIIYLREISERKKIEWSKENAIASLNDFLDRAYHRDNRVRFFYCALLNKNKVDILCSSFNPHLSKKILEEWYTVNPNYTRDYEKDKESSEIIIGFLKQQYVLNSLEFTDPSVLSSVNLIFRTVMDDDFWAKKSLKSISNHLPEFVQRIKSEKNGRGINSGGVKQAPVVTIKPKGGFGKL